MLRAFYRDTFNEELYQALYTAAPTRSEPSHTEPDHTWHVLIDYENVSWVKDIPFPTWCTIHCFQSMFSTAAPMARANLHVVASQCKDAADHKMTFCAGQMVSKGVRKFAVVTNDGFYRALIACLRDENCVVALCRTRRELADFLDTPARQHTALSTRSV